jgi:hypothetical protein
MTGVKSNVCLIIFLASAFSSPTFSQQINYSDSLNQYKPQQVDLKPRLSYSVGSTFMYVPYLGSVTGFTISPSLSVPLSPRLSVNAGVIAGRYYSTLGNSSPEMGMYGAFSEVSVYGSMSYQVNPQLTLYGAGIRSLAGTAPLYSLPKTSYTIGSIYKFGNVSIGVSLEMSKWNNNLSPLPFTGSRGFYSPYMQRPGAWY